MTTPPAPAVPRVDLAVPAYAHPLADPLFWDDLVAAAPALRFVVLNVHDGPGADLDPAYAEVVERLAAARVRTVGYVDTAYGARPADEVVADARTWVSRFAVHGVFLDQVAPGFATLGHYADCTLGARSAGAHFVVMNPGGHCHPGLAEMANVLVTFEGPWTDYVGYVPQAWTAHRPAARFCHLVHTVPPQAVTTGPATAADRRAGTAFFTTGTLPNPWDRLSRALVGTVREGLPAPAVPAPDRYPWRQRRFEPGTTGTAGAAVPAGGAAARVRTTLHRLRGRWSRPHTDEDDTGAGPAPEGEHR